MNTVEKSKSQKVKKSKSQKVKKSKSQKVKKSKSQKVKKKRNHDRKQDSNQVGEVKQKISTRLKQNKNKFIIYNFQVIATCWCVTKPMQISMMLSWQYFKNNYQKRGKRILDLSLRCI